MDRRSIRTEQLIKDTFINLLMTKKLKDITVTELTSIANLDRRTFYLHYKDIIDLNDRIISEFTDNFKARINNDESVRLLNDNPLSFISIILDYLFENKNLCIANLSTNYNSKITNQLLHTVHEKGVDIIHKRFPNCTDLQMELFYSFCVYGSFGIIINWIETGLEVSQQTIILEIEHIVKATSAYLE